MPFVHDRPGRMPANSLFRLVPASGDEIEQCRQLACNRLGILFPREYVHRGTIWSLVDERHRICGGLILVDKPPFRSLEGIPSGAAPAGLDELQSGGSLAEINGVWLSLDWRSPFATLTYWTLMLDRLLETGCDKFLFSHENGNRQMSSFVQWMSPKILYSGPTKCLPGMKGPANETIALIDRALVASMLEVISQGHNPKRTSGEQSLIGRLQTRTQKAAAIA
jgi:hypothetical protein